MLFLLCYVWPHLLCARIQSSSLIESLDVSPIFRLSIPYDWPSSSEDAFSWSRLLFLLFFRVHQSSTYGRFFNILVSRLELRILSSFLSAASLVSLVKPLAYVSFYVFPQDLRFFDRISVAMQHAHVGPSRLVAQTVCTFSLAPAGVALIGVGWWVVSSSLFCHSMTIVVGICPVLFILIRFPPFLDLFRGFHLTENLMGIPVSPVFKVPSSYVRLFVIVFLYSV